MSSILETAVAEITEVRARLCRQCETDDDALAVASAFLTEAMFIHQQIGGIKTTAAVLRAHADRLDAPRH